MFCERQGTAEQYGVERKEEESLHNVCERHGRGEQYGREKGGGKSSECSVKGKGQLNKME